MENKPTAEQQAIFDFIERGRGNAVINAVAGAGKTTTIMGCVKHIPLFKQNSVLFCAFNRSIVNELQEKFKKNGAEFVKVKTSYGLGAKILTDNGKRILKDENDKIDEKKCNKIAQSDDFIRFIAKHLVTIFNYHYENSIDEQFFADFFEYAENQSEDKSYYFYLKKQHTDISSMLDTIVEINKKFRLTLAENTPQDLDDKVLEHFGVFKDEDKVNKEHRPTKDEVIEAYFHVNEELLQRSNSLAEQGDIDFADMLYLPYHWNLSPKWSYQYIFVDECQDLSRAQQEIIYKYKLEPAGRIIAVGDPHQAIYGFNGADATAFETMTKRLNATVFPLTGTFRCPHRVVEKAQEIVPHIKANGHEIGKVEEITRQQMLEMIQPSDYIISRAKHTLADLIFELLPTNLQLQVIPENGKEVIDTLKGLFTESELKKNVLLFRKKALKQQIERRLREQVYKGFVDITGYDYIDKEEELNDYLGKVDFCFAKLHEWKCSTLEQVIEKVKERLNCKSEEAVKLLTIHRVKGQEANRIFILDADKLPLSYPGILPWQETQEDNLRYVAYTRAIKELYLVKRDEIAFDWLSEEDMLDEMFAPEDSILDE